MVIYQVFACLNIAAVSGIFIAVTFHLSFSCIEKTLYVARNQHINVLNCVNMDSFNHTLYFHVLLYSFTLWSCPGSPVLIVSEILTMAFSNNKFKS